MSYSIYPTPDFKKYFKKLYKKFPSLKADLQELINKLSEEPDTCINLGHGIYKIRLAITSKGKGKSSGARVITYLLTENMRSEDKITKSGKEKNFRKLILKNIQVVPRIQ